MNEPSRWARVATAALLIGILVVLSLLVGRLLWPQTDGNTDPLVAEADITLDEALAELSAGRPRAEPTLAAADVAAVLQDQADALATDGGIESLWNMREALPDGVVVDVMYFCHNDVGALCSSSLGRAGPIAACSRRPATEHLTVHAEAGARWAIVVACLWWPTQTEQLAVQRAVSGQWLAVVGELGPPAVRSTELDRLAASPVEAIQLDRGTTTLRRVTSPDDVGHVTDHDLADDFSSFTLTEIATASSLAYGSSVTVEHGHVVVVGVWSWDPD